MLARDMALGISEARADDVRITAIVRMDAGHGQGEGELLDRLFGRNADRQRIAGRVHSGDGFRHSKPRFIVR